MEVSKDLNVYNSVKSQWFPCKLSLGEDIMSEKRSSCQDCLLLDLLLSRFMANLSQKQRLQAKPCFWVVFPSKEATLITTIGIALYNL